MVFIKGHIYGKRFSKGFIPWNKGKSGYHVHSEKHKLELSEKFKGRTSPMKGRKHSEETKLKIGLGNKGKKISAEQKDKLRLSKLGNKNPMFGKTHSNEYKNRLRIESKGKGGNNWKGGITPESKLRLTNAFWKKRRNEVYERDSYKCVLCKIKCRGTDRKICRNTIQCHHIVPWRETRDDSIDNLITLCLSCHSKVENNEGFNQHFAKQLFTNILNV